MQARVGLTAATLRNNVCRAAVRKAADWALHFGCAAYRLRWHPPRPGDNALRKTKINPEREGLMGAASNDAAAFSLAYVEGGF